MSENPDLHPTNVDLFVGTPDLGHPRIPQLSGYPHPPIPFIKFLFLMGLALQVSLNSS